MITKQKLAEMLSQHDAKTVADLAQVNVKTIYRLRACKHVPRLDMVERLLTAMKQAKRK